MLTCVLTVCRTVVSGRLLSLRLTIHQRAIAFVFYSIVPQEPNVCPCDDDVFTRTTSPGGEGGGQYSRCRDFSCNFVKDGTMEWSTALGRAAHAATQRPTSLSLSSSQHRSLHVASIRDSAPIAANPNVRVGIFPSSLPPFVSRAGSRWAPSSASFAILGRRRVSEY